jgi:hypothetical protein
MGTWAGAIDMLGAASINVVGHTWSNTITGAGWIRTGTFNSPVSCLRISTGTFNSSVFCSSLIENGTFNGALDGYAAISNGTFSEVKGCSAISGGVFNGNIGSCGNISGGTFAGSILWAGVITGGTFAGRIYSADTITFGTHNQPIWVRKKISGGTFNDKVFLGIAVAAISTDYGATFFPKSVLSAGYADCACSADGVHVYDSAGYNQPDAVGGFFASHDSGENIRRVLFPGEHVFDNYGVSVACSDNGQIIHRIDGINLTYLKSTDYGATWSARISKPFNKIRCSADGQKVIALVNGNSKPQISLDGGATWQEKGTARNYYDVAVSRNGNIFVAVVNGGYIYTSTDNGNNWTQRAVSKYWFKVSVSADGTKMLALNLWESSVYPYKSLDSGVTWTPLAQQYVAYSCLVSPNGSRMFLGCRDSGVSYIYSSSDNGINWTKGPHHGYTNITCLACTTNGSRLYIGTDSKVLSTSYQPKVEETISGGTFNGEVRMICGNITGGTFNAPVIHENNKIIITGGTYAPRATVNFTLVNGVYTATGWPSDVGFARGGGTYAPVITYTGLSQAGVGMQRVRVGH